MTGETHFTLTKKLKSYKREERLLMVCSEHCVLLFHVRFPFALWIVAWPLKMRLIDCPEKSVITNIRCETSPKTGGLTYYFTYICIIYYAIHITDCTLFVYICIYKHVICGRFQEQFRLYTILEPTCQVACDCALLNSFVCVAGCKFHYQILEWFVAISTISRSEDAWEISMGDQIGVGIPVWWLHRPVAHNGLKPSRVAILPSASG